MFGKIREIRSSRTVAHVAPLAVFLVLSGIMPFFHIENTALSWYKHSPEQWLYPLQTVLCFGVLGFFWHHYSFKPFCGFPVACLLGVLTIAFWILPSHLYTWLDIDDPEGESWWRWIGVAVRQEGFDPSFFRDKTFWYWGAITMRFVRMVVVVALVEEIFWRGFLMRWLVDTDRPFWKIPFGTYKPVAAAVTTVCFMLIHAPVDYLGALVFGLAMAWVTVRTKSLAACVLMHAVANLLLGIYVMVTGNSGFW